MNKTLDKSKHSKLIDFLTNNFNSIKLDGKEVIQTLDGDFIDYVLMDEDYFASNWLTQFAIGRVGDKNYFNLEGWYELTDSFTKGVIVINRDKLPTCLIRKLTDMNIDPNEQNFLTHFSRIASNACHIPDKQEVDQLLAGFADAVTRVVSKEQADGLTDLIPLPYYQSFGVYPDVLKQVIFIRDNYKYEGNPITPDNTELLKRIEDILLKNHLGESVSLDEKKLINEITKGDFIFNGTSNTVDDKNTNTQETEIFDPLNG